MESMKWSGLLAKIEPIEREITRISKELDSLWDAKEYDTERADYLLKEYERLKAEQLDGEMYYIPF